MAITPDLYKTMCAYFDGVLTLEEEKLFLEQVEKNPELKTEFEWEEKMIFNAVPFYQEEKILASDANFHYDETETENSVNKPFLNAQPNLFRKWAIAASLLILIGVFAIIIILKTKTTTEHNKGLVKENENIPGVLIPDSSSAIHDTSKKEQTVNILKTVYRKKQVNKLGLHRPNISVEPQELGQIQEAFLKEKYTGAIQLTTKSMQVRGNAPSEDRLQTYLLFYRGISYLELDNDSAAIRTFKTLIEMKNVLPELMEESRWNLAKAYYKSDNSMKALLILKELIKISGFEYAAEVKKLMEMIKAEKK